MKRLVILVVALALLSGCAYTLEWGANPRIRALEDSVSGLRAEIAHLSQDVIHRDELRIALIEMDNRLRVFVESEIADACGKESKTP